MRWRRDDRQHPDDRSDVSAEDWLKEFRPVRPDSLTAADPDSGAAGRAAARRLAESRGRNPDGPWTSPAGRRPASDPGTDLFRRPDPAGPDRPAPRPQFPANAAPRRSNDSLPPRPVNTAPSRPANTAAPRPQNMAPSRPASTEAPRPQNMAPSRPASAEPSRPASASLRPDRTDWPPPRADWPRPPRPSHAAPSPEDPGLAPPSGRRAGQTGPAPRWQPPGTDRNRDPLGDFNADPLTDRRPSGPLPRREPGSGFVRPAPLAPQPDLEPLPDQLRPPSAPGIGRVPLRPDRAGRLRPAGYPAQAPPARRPEQTPEPRADRPARYELPAGGEPAGTSGRVGGYGDRPGFGLTGRLADYGDPLEVRPRDRDGLARRPEPPGADQLGSSPEPGRRPGSDQWADPRPVAPDPDPDRVVLEREDHWTPPASDPLGDRRAPGRESGDREYGDRGLGDRGFDRNGSGGGFEGRGVGDIGHDEARPASPEPVTRPRDLSALLHRGSAPAPPQSAAPASPPVAPAPESAPLQSPSFADAWLASEVAATTPVAGPEIQPVPGIVTADPDEPPDDDRDDDTLTTPLPAILPGATSVPRPAPVEEPRGFFEPARPENRPVSVTGAVEPPPESYLPDGDRPLSKAAADKLDQLKDLYLTAEAIGESALDKHFDQVSQRQRKLIKEFFDRSEPGHGGQQR